MNRAMRWLLYAAVGFVGLLVVVVAGVYGISEMQLRSQAAGGYDGTISELNIPYDDEEALARGEHLVRYVGHCTSCHGDDLGGDTIVDDFLIGRLGGPNLTTGEGGFAGENSTEDLIRAIRYGAHADGEKMVIMPGAVYYHMTDEDLAATIAYIESVPPVDRERIDTRAGALLRLMVVLGQAELFEVPDTDVPAPREALADSDSTVDQGHYLALIAGCVECHGEQLDGGQVLDVSVPAIHQNSPAANWTEEQFLETIRTGVNPGGHELDETMPWAYYAGMTDEELLAIHEYIRSVSPE